AQLVQHLLEQHADQHLVLDHQYPASAHVVASRSSIASTGASMVQTTPSGCQSMRTSPCSSVASPRSIMREPKPRWPGVDTAGPPVSSQRSRKRPPLTVQCTETAPPSRDNAPYFSALVPSSCNAIDRAT